MNDYTPTTEEIRKNWGDMRKLKGGVVNMYSLEQFDRWFAEVKAQAWEEGFSKGVNFFNAGDSPNPYRQGEEQ